MQKIGNRVDQICLSAVKISSISCDFETVTQSCLWSKGKQKFGAIDLN